MHELSVCQSLLRQVEALARDHGAKAITAIRLRIGPLSGVEAPLLERAFSVARAGTLAAQAGLDIETLPIRVTCTRCAAETEALPNRLLCGACGDWRTRVTSGDEMLLTGVELEIEHEESPHV